MSINLHGVSTAIEQPKEKKYVQGEGWQMVRTWHGTQTEIEGLIDSVKKDAEDISISQEGAKHVLKASFSDDTLGMEQADNTPKDDNISYEMQYNELEIALSQHPYFAEELTDENKLQKAIIHFDKWREVKPDEATVYTYNYKSKWDLNTEEGTRFDNYVKMIKKGVTAFVDLQPVLTVSIQLATRGTYKHAILDINQIVSVSSILSKAKFAEPKYKNTAGNLTSYQRLKKCPVIQKSGKRYNIQEQYIGFKSASTILYGGSDAP